MFGRNKDRSSIIESPAEVLSIADTGMTINDNPRVKMTLRVTPQDGAPFEIQTKATVSRINIPRVGDRFRVQYYADKPEGARLQRRTPEDLAASVAARAGASPAAVAGPAVPSPVDSLRELASLHSSGALTDDEFAAAKSRLLASA
jgi:hypothetical protein